MWIVFFVSFAVALVLTPAARTLASRWGVLDRPDGRRKLHAQPVPLWGGVAVYFSLLAGLAFTWAALEPPEGFTSLAASLGLSAGFVCLLGCVDDVRNLSARFKLLLQLAAVSPVLLAGYVVREIVVFGVPVQLGYLSVPLTVLWLIGCINALNLLDGMDGMATTVGLSTALMMTVIAVSMGHNHVAWCALILAGALAGFLLYNLPPASIYLGDSGSMVIGLACGMLAIQGAMKTTTTLSLTAPALVLAVPMLDTALAVLRRRLTGQSIAAPDRGHLHHRLLERGLSTWQALCVVGALCLATGALAAAATWFRSDALAWVLLLTLFVLLVRLRIFGHYETSLVKSTVVAWLRKVRLGTVAPRQLRADMEDFQQAFDLLARELADWDALELQAEWTGPTPATPSCTWCHVMDQSNEADTWQLSVSQSTPQRQTLLLKTTIRRRGGFSAWHLAQVAQRLEDFARFWAQQLPEILAAEQRPAAEALPPATVSARAA